MAAEMIDWVTVDQIDFVEEDIENVDYNYYSHDDDWDIEMGEEDVDTRMTKKVDEMKMKYYCAQALVDDWMKKM